MKTYRFNSKLFLFSIMALITAGNSPGLYANSPNLNDPCITPLEKLTSTEVAPGPTHRKIPFGINLNEAFSNRGFLGTIKSLGITLEQVDELQNFGIDNWGIEVYVKKTIEEARAHDAADSDPALQGVYFISDMTLENQTKSDAENLFDQLLKSNARMVYFETTQPANTRQMVEVSPAVVAKMLDAEGVILRTRKTSRGLHFWRTGLVYPEKLIGKFNFSNLWGSKKTYKEIARKIRAVYAAGGSIQFTTKEEDFRHDLQLAATTPRKDQDAEESSRLRVPETFERVMGLFRKGRAFTIRVVDGQGQILGGILCMRNGNSVDFNTTFYLSENGGIEYAKMGAVALFQRLEEQDLSELHIDMISPFSYGLKAERVSMDERLKAIKKLADAPAIPYDFTSAFKLEKLK